MLCFSNNCALRLNILSRVLDIILFTSLPSALCVDQDQDHAILSNLHKFDLLIYPHKSVIPNLVIDVGGKC